MDCGGGGGGGFDVTWWPQRWILTQIRNYQRMGKFKKFDVRDREYDIIKHFAALTASAVNIWCFFNLTER